MSMSRACRGRKSCSRPSPATPTRRRRRHRTQVRLGARRPGADVNPPADLKTVHYFVRPGDAVEPGSAAATSLAPDAQAARRRTRAARNSPRDAGLRRADRAIPARSIRAQCSSRRRSTQIQFRYFDGSQLADEWDMKERKSCRSRSKCASGCGPLATADSRRRLRLGRRR